MTDLHELVNRCIHCGLCLESCPSYVLTGDETQSPRGRIHLVRAALEGRLEWDETIDRPLQSCLGCRACETACPSGVQYGQVLEGARGKLRRTRPETFAHWLANGMTDPGRFRRQLAAGRLWPGRRVPPFVSWPLAGVPAQAEMPQPQSAKPFAPLSEEALPPVRGEVYLLEGCVMSVLYPRVNEATRRLLRRVGFAVRPALTACCGSLHAHLGYMEDAKRRAEALSASFEGDLPIIVNAAGCGSTMKEYGLLSSDLEALGSRVRDISEFLDAEGLPDVLASTRGLDVVATYHDACHLAHGQGIRKQPRRLLQSIPGLTLVELEEADMCCGSAGIYNLTQPKLARRLLERKWAHVERTGASVVASGNPGCHAWIAQAAREHGSSVEVVHTVELLERAFHGPSEGAESP